MDLNFHCNEFNFLNACLTSVPIPEIPIFGDYLETILDSSAKVIGSHNFMINI